MKKTVRTAASVCLAVALAFSLTACDEDEAQTSGTNGTANALVARPTEDITYQNASAEEGTAYYTGKTIDASIEDTRYGGPQFVSKLFTEGVSRAPEAEEYVEYTGILEEKGCTVETLSSLAETFFSSETFQNEKLSDREKTFAVYRAILSREPSEEELSEHENTDAVALAKELCASEEFAALLPDINEGPYYWNGNNASVYTGGNVMTSSDIQELFKESNHVVLPQGTQVLVDSTISIPEGGTLETEGNPTHYAKMARLIRAGSSDYHLVIVQSGASMKNIYVEGGLSGFETNEVLSGSNVLMRGSGGTVSNCRISDSVSHQNLWAIDASEYGYIGHNLITGYASNHDTTWQDGITCLGADFVIEYNDVVDVTDASIAIFRYVDAESETPHSRAQNSIVRYNTMVALGNSAYVAYDHETGNYHTDSSEGTRHPANMTGLVAYENQIWTSMRAHYHMMITMSTVPWLTEANCDRTVGGSVYNNYTPEGCYALTACAIAVDKVTDVAVRGNSFHIYLGEWCRPTQGMGARIYSVNESNTSKSDLQAGYVNRQMAPKGAAFICTLAEGLELEDADHILLKEAVVHEDKQTIPLSRFQAGTVE